jgi:hypothetical protein
MKRLRLRRGWLTDGVGHWPEWMILVPLDQDPTLICVVEPSRSSWLVAGMIPGVERRPLKSWSLIVDGGIVNLDGRGMLLVSVARRLGSEGPLLA